jgi:hypothetical protein
MDMIVHAEDGIETISIVQAINATIEIPAFNKGTKDPLTCTVTKVDSSKRAVALLEVCTVDGCCEVVDPVLTTLQIMSEKTQARESFASIPAAEHLVTIQNGHPGLRKFYVFVNGQQAAYLPIGPKEVQTIDIATSMTKAQNTITLIGQGRPGASALVLISDVPGPDAKGMGGNLKYQPLVEWESGTGEADVNMHWGGGEADVM